MNKLIDDKTGETLATVQLPLCLLMPGNILDIGKWLVKIKFVKVIFKPSQGVYDEIAERQIHVEVF